MDGYKKERMDDYLNKLIVSLSVELFKKEVNDSETVKKFVRSLFDSKVFTRIKMNKYLTVKELATICGISEEDMADKIMKRINFLEEAYMAEKEKTE